MKQQTRNKIEWKEVALGEVLDYEQPQNYIVKSVDYSDEYETPVLTAGKSFILGYTKEKKGVCNNLPVIIFDDFTTANKYVNFKFKVKSSAMKLLTPKNKDIDLKFVFLAMQNLKFDAIRHKRYYLSAFQYLKIPLPFSNGKPDIKTQQKIASILEKTENLKQKRKNSDELLDEYLKAVFSEMFLKDKEGFEEVEIIKGVLKTENKTPEKDFPNKLFKYVDISSIDNKSKRIIETKEILGKDAPSRAKQLIKYNDVLISTVRPNLNSVAIVEKNLDNQICSTGFCILRADNKNFIPEYLYFISRENFFIDKLVNKCKGATYPAVSNKDIFSLKIPLPPLPLQQKFAKIVEQVEKIKEKQNNSKEEINGLFDALMSTAFKGELR